MTLHILNSDSKCPEIFYIFVNRNLPITNHNLNFTKTLFSAGYMNCNADTSFLEKYLNGTATYNPLMYCESDLKAKSPFCINIINECRVELDAEYFRYEHYPFFPSRFSSVFAFGDYTTCEKVAEKYRWDIDTVEKFNLMGDPLTRIVKTNMEIVSLARHAYRVSSMDRKSIEYIWNAYWKGEGNLSIELLGKNFHREICESGEIYEYLIEGILKLKE